MVVLCLNKYFNIDNFSFPTNWSRKYKWKELLSSYKILILIDTRPKENAYLSLFFYNFFRFLFYDNFTTYWCTRKFLPWSVRRTGGAWRFLTWMNVSALLARWFRNSRFTCTLPSRARWENVASFCVRGRLPRDKLLVVGKPKKLFLFVSCLCRYHCYTWRNEGW